MLLLVLGLSFVGAPAATPASTSDAQGPPCSNITDGDGSYAGTLGGSGSVDFTIYIQASACSAVTYSFFVTDTDGNAIAPSSLTQDSNCIPQSGGDCVHFVYGVSSSPQTVCVYATTALHVHRADLAPNASDPFCPSSSPSRSIGLNGGVGAQGSFG
jgi:hypothetical protein